MKIKNKGKVYPSPSSSSASASSSASGSDGDYLSVLKLLPAAILAIASVLSLEDREVLAYMITISMKTTITTTTATTKRPTTSIDSKRSSKSSKKASSSSNNATHNPPVFDCDCFECYTSYWFKWDSSPNRELIHQAIEAFEEHLTKGESEKSKKGSRTRRRDKSGRRIAVKPADVSGELETLMPVVAAAVEESGNYPKDEVASQEVTMAPSSSVSFVVDDNNKVLSPENDMASSEKMSEEVEVAAEVEEEEEEDMAVSTRTTTLAATTHKGLARKVLPDVLGLFNSRLWNLWGPNV